MEMGYFVKGFLIVLGVVLFITDLISLARRKIDSAFSVVWGVLAIVLVLLGVFLSFGVLSRYMSWQAVIFITVGVTALLFSLYRIVQYISELTSRNQELVIQVSLLNEESRQLKESVRQLQQAQAEKETRP